MDDYSQPDFYRFNQDSLELVNFIVRRGVSAHSILDLGAGSGIIGIELARRLKAKELTLVELQAEYEMHLKKNVGFYLDPATQCNIVLSSFNDFRPQQKFDLIVSNPPYYFPGAGELAQDPRRALARTFIQDSWEVLLQKVAECLVQDGQVYMVLKGNLSLQKQINRLAAGMSLAVKFHELRELLILEIFTLNKN